MEELISPQELHTQLAEQNAPTVVDVRGPEEFRTGHIPGAVHIPAEEVERSLAQIPKDRPVVPY